MEINKKKLEKQKKSKNVKKIYIFPARLDKKIKVRWCRCNFQYFSMKQKTEKGLKGG